MKLSERKVDEKKAVALNAYEELLLGKSKIMCNDLCTKMSKTELARYIWECAMKTLCHFDSEQAIAYCDDKLVEQLYLNRMIDLFELKPHLAKNNYGYALSLVYEGLSYTKKSMVIEEFEHVNHLGAFQGMKDNYHFPKEFFKNIDRQFNVSTCLAYSIEHFLYYMDDYQLYEFFSKDETAVPFLKGLGFPKEIYKDGTLDFFYQMVPEEKKNPFLYECVKFNQMLKK